MIPSPILAEQTINKNNLAQMVSTDLIENNFNLPLRKCYCQIRLSFHVYIAAGLSNVKMKLIIRIKIL
jgi:hypothetical protein